MCFSSLQNNITDWLFIYDNVELKIHYIICIAFPKYFFLKFKRFINGTDFKFLTIPSLTYKDGTCSPFFTWCFIAMCCILTFMDVIEIC